MNSLQQIENHRRIQHVVPLSNRVLDTATNLGIIVVEGFNSGNDLMRLGDILETLESASGGQVLWFGGAHQMNHEYKIDLNAGVESRQILMVEEYLSTIIADLRAIGKLGRVIESDSEEVVIITHKNGNQLETTHHLRLTV